jgi:isoleucyl-tRNA synthetase
LDVKKLDNYLDKWIVSRVYELRNEIVDGTKKYDLPTALSGVLPFVDDLSNWFVRRSRRRFWKSGDSADKEEAYKTLAFVLRYLALILAPFVPFLTEELWQKLNQDGSVHLQDYPTAGKVDDKVLADMMRTREIISNALALRMEKNDGFGQVKVRQPLSLLVYDGEKLDNFYEQIIAEEVNVKSVKNGKKMKLDKKLTKDLKLEGQTRELIRFVQNLRKKSGLEVDDRIRLVVHNLELPDNLIDLVKAETLALEYDTKGNCKFDEIVKIGDKDVTVSLEKLDKS